MDAFAVSSFLVIVNIIDSNSIEKFQSKSNLNEKRTTIFLLIDYKRSIIIMGTITATTNVKEPTSVLERFTLKGKKAVVTGAAGGIGRATATAFAELGADVAIVDIPAKMERCRQTAEVISGRFGGKAIAVGGDVADPVSVEQMVAQIVKELGTIDVVHSNAGISALGDEPDMPIEQWKKIIDINLTGVMIVDTACARVMRKHKHGGSIINTSSISGHIVNPPYKDEPNMVAYATSKAAVLHLTKSLALNYIKYGIRVNSISPGYVWSGIHDGYNDEVTNFYESTVPMKHFGSLDDLTGAVALMATDLGAYMVGTDIVVDGGICIL